MDGASNNRKFLSTQCEDHENYTIVSPFNTDHAVTVMLDPMVSTLALTNLISKGIDLYTTLNVPPITLMLMMCQCLPIVH